MKWEDKIICAQRIQNSWYSTSDCPNNYKRCNSYTCVYQDNLCPITDIKIYASTKTVSNYAGYQQLNDDNNIYYWRSTGTSGVVAMTVAVNDPPCLSKYLEPVFSPKYPLYDLTLGCGSYGDDSTNS